MRLIVFIILGILYRYNAFARRFMKLAEPPQPQYPTCKICFGPRHGLPDPADGCPGQYATPQQEQAYWDARRVRR